MWRTSRQVLSFLAPAFVLAIVWEVVGASSMRAGYLIARPSAVLLALLRSFHDIKTLYDCLVTTGEGVAGLILGTGLGAFVGLALWFSPAIARIARPYVVALGSLPILAIAPIMIVWFGIGYSMKVACATLGPLLVAISHANQGAHSVDPDQVRLFRMFGATKNQIFRNAILPSALTWVFASLKLNVSFAFLGAFLGEFISSERGLGHDILRAAGVYNVPRVLADSALLAAITLALTWCVEWLERRQFQLLQFFTVPEVVRSFRKKRKTSWFTRLWKRL